MVFLHKEGLGPAGPFLKVNPHSQIWQLAYFSVEVNDLKRAPWATPVGAGVTSRGVDLVRVHYWLTSQAGHWA